MVFGGCCCSRSRVGLGNFELHRREILEHASEKLPRNALSAKRLRHDKASDGSDMLAVFMGVRIKDRNCIFRPGTAPTHSLVLSKGEMAPHLSGLDTLGHRLAVFPSRPVFPGLFAVIRIKAVAITLRPFWVVMKCQSIKKSR